MKKHRIFIAINLPQDVKKALLSHQRQWGDLPVRWTRAENLHLTLVFLGYLDDGEVAEVCRQARAALQNCASFDIEFNKICLGPPRGMPRMIWAEGEVSRALAKLYHRLADALSAERHRQLKVHVTLARLRQGRHSFENFKEKDIFLTAPVYSVEIMESFLSRKGPEYVVLESIELK